MARLLGCVFIPLCLLSGACSGAARHPKAAVASKPTRAARVECVEDPAVPWASNALHWYRARDGEAPQRVLHFSAGAAKAQRESGFVRFSASITGTTSTLTVTDARTDDAATYYCATWVGGGDTATRSGARPKPTVSVYGPSDPAADRVTMLCRASDMFPNVVRISWMFRQAGGWVGVSQAAEKPEVLEAEGQDPSSRSSVMVLAREQAERNHYRCEVEHEMGKEGRDMDTGTGAPALRMAKNPPQFLLVLVPTGDFKAGLSLNLATLAYTVMISKCLVYFSLVSTLLLTRRTAKIQSFHRNRIS
uniref:Ig-like domain-containing protein n=1 Tax=Denticeps clupeoides TaxID=299321 RepID=A0AAY4DTD1_9TELE